MKNINHTVDNTVTSTSIREDFDSIAQAMFAEFKALQRRYWELHAQIGEAEFNSWHEQNEAIMKLSELGIALKKFGDAYSAMNTVRCITC